MSPWTHDGTVGIIVPKNCRTFALSFREDDLATPKARRAAWSRANHKINH